MIYTRVLTSAGRIDWRRRAGRGRCPRRCWRPRRSPARPCTRRQSMLRQAAQRLQGLPSMRIFAVDGLGQDFSAGRLAGTARAGEQVGVAQTAGPEADFSASGSRPADRRRRQRSADGICGKVPDTCHHLPVHSIRENGANCNRAGAKNAREGRPFRAFYCPFRSMTRSHTHISNPEPFPFPEQPAQQRRPCGTRTDPLNAARFPA